MLDTPLGPDLGLLCFRQSGAVSIYENYSISYFDAKHLNKGWWNFSFPFFKKNPYFGQFRKLPKFSRIGPTHHNIKL